MGSSSKCNSNFSNYSSTPTPNPSLETNHQGDSEHDDVTVVHSNCAQDREISRPIPDVTAPCIEIGVSPGVNPSTSAEDAHLVSREAPMGEMTTRATCLVVKHALCPQAI